MTNFGCCLGDTKKSDIILFDPHKYHNCPKHNFPEVICIKKKLVSETLVPRNY